MEISFICECDNVDLSKLIAMGEGNKTTIEILEDRMIKITIKK